MNIYASIASIMKQGYSIAKEKDNKQQGFKYRGIDDVMNVFQPLMADAGIFVVPEVLEHHREDRTTKNGSALIYSVMKIKYTFYAEDGSCIAATVIGEGMDSGDKASNKAMAVAMKYAMFQVFCIPTEEMKNDDPDRTTPEDMKPVTPKPAKNPEKNDDSMLATVRQELDSDGYYHCKECKEVIGRAKKNDGSYMMPEEIALKSFNTFGKCLCLKCAKKAQALLNDAKQHA